MTESAKRHQEAERHRQAERRPDPPLTSTPSHQHPLPTPLDGRSAAGAATCEPSINRGFAVPFALTSGEGPRTARLANFFLRPAVSPLGGREWTYGLS
jgi:hypothetical protein